MMSQFLLSNIRTICVAASLLFFYGNGMSQGWERALARGYHERGFAVRQTADGGYIIAAVTNGSVLEIEDIWLVKTNPYGDIEWQKTIGVEDEEDVAMDLEIMPDGGFIMAGHTSRGQGEMDNYIVRTDAQGDTIWTKVFGTPMDEELTKLCLTDDGGIVFTGTMEHQGSDGITKEMSLLKTDLDGNIEWVKHFGYPAGDEYAYSICKTGDGYIVAGTTYSFGQAGKDAFVVKTNLDGVEQWSTHFGGVHRYDLLDVVQLSDGGLVVGGRSTVGSIDSLLVVKLSSGGAIQWTKKPGRGVVYTLVNDDTEVVLGGYFYYFGGETADPCMIKLDEDGNTLWSHKAGLFKQDDIFDLQPTNDGGYIGTGLQVNPYSWFDRVYLIKTDSVGVTDPLGIDLAELNNGVIVYPNPFTTKLNFKLSENIPASFRDNDDLVIELFSYTGQSMARIVGINDGFLSLNFPTLSPGLYYYAISSSDRVLFSDKLVAE